MSIRSRQHYAVRRGNGVQDRKPCRFERSRPIEIHHSSLLHDCNSPQRFIFIPLQAHSLEYFE
jgi:hypothetical protein